MLTITKPSLRQTVHLVFCGLEGMNCGFCRNCGKIIHDDSINLESRENGCYDCGEYTVIGGFACARDRLWESE